MPPLRSLEQYAKEGRVFVANMGSVTTPITFLVTAANRPDAWIRVPSGTTIIPISVHVTLEARLGDRVRERAIAGVIARVADDPETLDEDRRTGAVHPPFRARAAKRAVLRQSSRRHVCE